MYLLMYASWGIERAVQTPAKSLAGLSAESKLRKTYMFDSFPRQL